MEDGAREKSTVAMSWSHLKMPPFPQVALKVLQLASNENVQLSKLGELISSDPAFASEVLTIANSMLYAPRYPIKSILQAVEVLGAGHLQGLCLTVGVRAYLGKWLGHPAMRTLWRHNMACALIAQQLASAGTMDRDIAYTAGVLHGIGMLALAVVRPQEYIHLLGTHIGTPASIQDRECAIFGIDHGQLGAQLVKQWKLPEDFEAVMSSSHTPRSNGECWGMEEIVSLSCRMADSAGYAAFPACHSTPFAELVEELPARERKLFHTDVETLSFEVSKKIGAVEAV
ncbi:MAG TPA: HDOD domain-containing protein [Terracidiphilus sp.]|jgi:HD-like signal output (HDOD) protein